MIKLTDHRVALMNLRVTIEAIDELDTLIDYYSQDKPGPAYTTFTNITGPGSVNVQMDRKIILPALVAQRQHLVDYMATLGIEV